mgnify:CR=1 FL=1
MEDLGQIETYIDHENTSVSEYKMECAILRAVDKLPNLIQTNYGLLDKYVVKDKILLMTSKNRLKAYKLLQTKGVLDCLHCIKTLSWGRKKNIV